MDLIDFGGLIIKSERIVLPHPRAHLRRFVIEPITEIDPLWMHPILNESASQILKILDYQSLKTYFHK